MCAHRHNGMRTYVCSRARPAAGLMRRHEGGGARARTCGTALPSQRGGVSTSQGCASERTHVMCSHTRVECSLRFLPPGSSPAQAHRQDQVGLRFVPYQARPEYHHSESQGQTINNAIVDIASPPTGSPIPFNVYVAMSRCRGRESIRLLRDFDEKLLASLQASSCEPQTKLFKLDTDTEKCWNTVRSINVL